MRKTFAEKRVPTLVALLILFLGIFGTTFLVQNLRPFVTRATPSEVPREIKITNVSPNSLAVSWITEASIAGSIELWEEGKPELTTLDDRDKPGIIGFYKTHHVTLGGLKPSTQYFFKINSGRNSYDSNDNPYRITTAEEIAPSASKKNLKIGGTVINEDGSPGKDLLIYATIEGAQNISTITSLRGEWSLLQNFRTADLKNYYDNDAQIINLLLTNGEKNSNIKVNFDNTIPTITLGQDYDFTILPPGGDKEATISSQNLPSKLKISPPAKSVTTPKVLSPKEGESFTDLQPRFSGTAPKGMTVKITIESPVIEDSVKADSNGNWSYRPKGELSPGEHTLTIATPDSNGIMRTITQKFKVFAAGNQVEETATPSATPTIKLSPTPTPTKTITPTPPPATPTQAPIPTKSPKPIPVTGDNFPPIVLGAFGVITFIIGLALLF